MSVSLVKGQKISLEKEAGGSLSRITMGLGWDAKKRKGFIYGRSQAKIDLDASCLLFDETKNLVDSVWFRQLQSKDGSIRHTGDNLTGDGDGDDEQILVNLATVPANVKYLVFTVNSFSGQSFEQIENAYCRLVNASDNKEVAKYNLSGGAACTAQIMAKVYRHNGEWKMHAIGENADGQTFNAMLPQIVAQL